MEVKPIKWYTLSKDIIVTSPNFEKSAEVTESFLFDSRLDGCIEDSKDVFDSVFISYIPLIYQGESISQESNENRWWIRGSGKYSFDTKPTSTQMQQLLQKYYCIIREIHNNKETLFLHPYLFNPRNYYGLSAPCIVQSTITQLPNNSRTFELKSPEKIDPEHGYFQIKKLNRYESRRLDEIWDVVNNRAEIKKSPLQKDLEFCLQSQHELIHDFLCSTSLYEGSVTGRSKNAIAPTSSCFVLPISVINRSRDQTIHLIPPNILGMVWLFFVAESWTTKQDECALTILRSVWLLAVSDSFHKRNLVEAQKGRNSSIAELCHDISRITEAINSANPECVLYIIKTYLKQLVDAAINKNKYLDEASGSKTDYNIKEILQDVMKLATRIELIVTITKRSSTITQAQYDNELSCMDKWLSEQVSLSSSISCLVCHLTERQKNSFELALMSALRNAIQHMWDKYLSTNVSGTMSIAATVEDNRKRIIITNTVVLRGFSSFTQGKNEGTKMSIQGHVGNYHPAASDLVKITRINQRQREDNFFEEEWKTVLPLPETTVVLGSDYVSSLHV